MEKSLNAEKDLYFCDNINCQLHVLVSVNDIVRIKRTGIFDGDGVSLPAVRHRHVTKTIYGESYNHFCQNCIQQANTSTLIAERIHQDLLRADEFARI